MKYIASCSFGKDSIATILLAREHNEPLDEIVYCEVMFDENISGELPEHRDFIYNVAIPKFEEWGYRVTVLRSKKTYMDLFNHVRTKAKNTNNNGKKVGFAMAGKCEANSRLKTDPIKKYWKSQDKNTVQYVGIAIDEPKRLDRVANHTNQISLLQKYNYTEEMARQKCIEYGLLSPIYEFTKRNGCWFCPNARDDELRHLFDNHRELWDELLDLEDVPNKIGKIWNTLTKTSIHDKDEQFRLEDAQMTIFDFIK